MDRGMIKVFSTFFQASKYTLFLSPKIKWILLFIFSKPILTALNLQEVLEFFHSYDFKIWDMLLLAF